jgi:chromosome segregation ATPase
MKKSAFVCLALSSLLVVGALVGCSSSGYQKGASTGATLQKASERIALTQVSLDEVLSALSELTAATNNLSTSYKRLAGAVSKLNSSAKNVTASAAAMQTRGEAYFQQWDKDLAQIKNEDIRSRSQARKTEVAERFARIKTHYQDARSSFTPLTSDLTDIQKALGADLTADGVKALLPIISRANREAVPVRQSLTKLAAEFHAMGVSLGQVPPPAK